MIKENGSVSCSMCRVTSQSPPPQKLVPALTFDAGQSVMCCRRYWWTASMDFWLLFFPGYKSWTPAFQLVWCGQCVVWHDYLATADDTTAYSASDCAFHLALIPWEWHSGNHCECREYNVPNQLNIDNWCQRVHGSWWAFVKMVVYAFMGWSMNVFHPQGYIWEWAYDITLWELPPSFGATWVM